MTNIQTLWSSGVSVLFSEPKIPQYAGSTRSGGSAGVSVLFSEPKIPQCMDFGMRCPILSRFSALQRAENSSMLVPANPPSSNRAFQCSSASRKFLNRSRRDQDDQVLLTVSVLFSEPKIPQFWSKIVGWWDHACFSALQRAENSSIMMASSGV